MFWRSRKNPIEEQRPEQSHDHALVLSVTSPRQIPGARQLRYVFRILTLTERRIFFGAFILGSLSLIVAFAFFIKSHVSEVPAVGGTYSEALIGQPKYLNPIDSINNDIDRDLVRLIFSGLFKMDGLKTIPDLAEQYDWSEDGKTFNVRLRMDAKFHNGEKVTMDDVLFTFDSIQDPNRKSPLYQIFKNVKISASDEQTLTFQLQQPDASFLSQLTIGILPSALWQEISASNARLSDLNLKPIGSGPFRIKSFSRDNLGNIHSYTLEGFDSFYGQKPFLKQLTFQFFVDRSEALEAFRSGLVDGLAFSGSHEIKDSTAERSHDVHLDLPQETVAFFNTKDPTLSNRDVRQALILSIFRDDLIAVTKNSAEIVTSPFPFGTVSSTQSDIERSRKLLSDTGWVLPENGTVRIKASKNTTATPSTNSTSTNSSTATASSTEFTLEISVPNEPDLLAIADILKRQWSLIGAKVTINSMPTEDLMKKATKERSAQIVLLNVLLGPDQNISPFWSSRETLERGLNISNVSDRVIDDALTKLQAATSTEAINQGEAEVTQAIERLYPAAFLLRPVQHFLISTKIKIPRYRFLISAPAERFTDLIKWYKNTKWQWN